MSSNIPTPHISAKEGEFARTVLMPGDPLRAKFIAETFLESDQQCARDPGIYRNMAGEKGFRNGQRYGLSVHRDLFL